MTLAPRRTCDTNTAAHVAPDPLVEHLDQEPPPLRRGDGPLGHQAAVLDVQRSLCVVGSAAQVRLVDRGRGGALDDGDELDETCTQRRRGRTGRPRGRGPALAAFTVHSTFDVDAVALEQVPALQHLVGGRAGPACRLGSTSCMLAGRPSDSPRGTDAPRTARTTRRQQGPVGLDGVLDRLSRVRRRPGPVRSPARKKSTPSSVGSPPCHAIVTAGGRGLGLDHLAHVGSQHVVAHPEAVAGVEPLLRQEEAVRRSPGCRSDPSASPAHAHAPVPWPAACSATTDRCPSRASPPARPGPPHLLPRHSPLQYRPSSPPYSGSWS